MAKRVKEVKEVKEDIKRQLNDFYGDVKIDEDDIVEDTPDEKDICELDAGEEPAQGDPVKPQKTYVARVRRKVKNSDGKEIEDYDIIIFDSEGSPKRRLMVK